MNGLIEVPAKGHLVGCHDEGKGWNLWLEYNDGLLSNINGLKTGSLLLYSDLFSNSFEDRKMAGKSGKINTIFILKCTMMCYIFITKN